MTENEKLRELLAEVRRWMIHGDRGAMFLHDLQARIDAALAEPVQECGVEFCPASRVLRQVKQERDEARAEVEKLRNILCSKRPEIEGAAYQRGAEAMREEVLRRLMPDPLKPPPVHGFSLWDAIKFMRIPEDKP